MKSERQKVVEQIESFLQQTNPMDELHPLTKLRYEHRKEHFKVIVEPCLYHPNEINLTVVFGDHQNGSQMITLLPHEIDAVIIALQEHQTKARSSQP